MNTACIPSILLALLLTVTGAYADQEPAEKTKIIIDDAGISISQGEGRVQLTGDKAGMQEQAPNEHGMVHSMGAESMLKQHFAGDMAEDSDINIAIPLFGIIFTFGTPIAIVWIIAAYGARRRRLMHETIEKFINAGLTIPSELFDDMKPSSASNRARHKGIVMTFLGLAVAIALSQLADTDVASIALIPMFMGLAYLVSWKLSKNDAKNGQIE